MTVMIFIRNLVIILLSVNLFSFNTVFGYFLRVITLLSIKLVFDRFLN